MNNLHPPIVLRLLLSAACVTLTTGAWPVYDAANHAENLRTSAYLSQLLQRQDARLLPDIQELLRIEAEQLEAWREYLRRLGDPARPPGPSGGAFWSWGDLGGTSGETLAGDLFDPQGVLTLYGQLGEGGWRDHVHGSWQRWATQARDAWMQELGAAAGLSEAEAAMAAWLAGLSPGEVRARRHEIARNLARLAAERWLETADDRRGRLEVLAGVAARQREVARTPATVLDALVQQNEAVAHATTTLVEGLRQQGEGAEAGLLLQRAMVEDAAEAVRLRRREHLLEWANLDAP